MDPLFERARRLTAEHGELVAKEAELGRQAHLANVWAAQQKLLTTLVDSSLEDAVLGAARQGKTEVELLAFQGSDTFDGHFCSLYLLKGPRLPEPGVVPLLRTLRQMLAPFRVKHVWDEGTVQNTVTLTWGARD